MHSETDTTQDWRRTYVVELLDDALPARDVERVKSFMSEDCEIVFPGFSACGRSAVDAMYAMIDRFFAPGVPTKSFDLWIDNGSDAITVHGTLFGCTSDGTSMDGIRYTDTFVFDADRRIVRWLVYNDVALHWSTS